MKRFNFIVQWLTIFLYVALQPAVAGLPPTRSSGQSDSLSTTFDFKAPYSQVTKYSGTGGLIETGNYQVLKNPSFEAATYSASWTASGGTLAAATSTNIFFGKSATWDASSASQTLTSDAITVPEGFKGNNCEASIYIKVPSGTATHTLSAFDGTNTLASASVINSVYFTKNTVTFPCPTSGTIALRITSVASDEPLIALDEGYLGLARNVGSAPLITEWRAFTPSGSWVANTTYTGLWRQVGDTYEYQVYLALAGAPTATALTINHLANGYAQDTAKLLNTSTDGRQTMAECIVRSAGTVYDSTAYYNGTNIAPIVKAAGGTYATASTNVNATVPATFANGDNIICKGSVPILGWPSSTVVAPDAQGWFASGFISGANPSMGSVAVTSYSEIANGSLSLTTNTGSASVGIACSSANASTVGSSTCSAGNEVIGFTTNVPRAGVYEACFQFGHVINIGGAAGGSLTAAFQIVETANSSGAITQEANGRVTSGAGYEGGSNSPNQVNPVMVCGTLNLSSGQKLIKLYYEQAIPSGTIFTNEVQADASATVGQRNIYFIIKPVNGQQQVVLANSVSTPIANGEKLGSAQLNCDSSSSIKRNRQSVVASIGNISAGICTVTLASGYFSGTPDVVASWDSSGTQQIVTATCSSATSCIIGGTTDAGVALTVADMNLIFIGPR